MPDLTASAVEGVRVQGMLRLAELWAEGDAAMERCDARGVIEARERRIRLRRLVAGEVADDAVDEAARIRRMLGGGL